jgi:hypothetical protein
MLFFVTHSKVILTNECVSDFRIDHFLGEYAECGGFVLNASQAAIECWISASETH